MDKKSRDLVMGKLYLKNKDYKMAEKSLLDYLNLSPEDFQALKMLAQVYEHLNNYQKAFDFYERSYLVEPERRGTLLDICRLLLIENSSLDHVDRKKWLKLAVQAFPTNPIVTNLRDSLPMLDTNPAPNKINIESELLSRLDRLEQRLTGIEEALTRLSVQKVPEPKTNSHIQHTPAKSVIVNPAKSETPPSASTPAKPQVHQPLTSFGKPVANTFPAPSLFGKIDKPASTQPMQTPSLFGTIEKPVETQVSVPQLAPKVEKQAMPLFQLSQLPIFKPAEPVTKPAEPAKSAEPAKPSKPAKPSEPAKPAEPAKPTELAKPAELQQQQPNDNSGNLFADSLKKFNLPTEGSWTTTAPTNSFSLFNFGSAIKIGSTPEARKENATAGGEEDGDGDGDDGTVEAPELPIENTCDMQPIEIKSGEEDEDIIFEHRCKLFRFRDKEYKERGLGNIKVLKHRETGAGRLIMRRDLINLVCLNCWSCSKIERVRDTQVRFAGLDASDGEPTMTVFLAKFKTQELTDTFMSHLTELFRDESE